MNTSQAKSFRRFAAAMCLVALSAEARADEVILTRAILTDTENRPFFPVGYSDGITTFANPRGYSGTGLPGGTTTTVTGVNLGLGGNGANGIPLGVTVDFDITFTVDVIGAGHAFSDGTEKGLGVRSPGEPDPPVILPAHDVPANELSPGEQLLFDDFQVTNVRIVDPIGQWEEGATIENPLWRGLRSNGHNQSGAPVVESASTSADAAVTSQVTVFDDNPFRIQNNGGFHQLDSADGVLQHLLSTLYLTTSSGHWPLKGIGYQVDVIFEPATAPATRRMFNFGFNEAPTSATRQLTSNDTTITLTAMGNAPLLSSNTFGIGVDSSEDTAAGDAGVQRFTDGTLATPEAIHFSFDQDVRLEMLTLGSLELDGTEGVVLSFVEGVDPFTDFDLDNYSAEYSLNGSSLTFLTSAGGQTPYPVPFGTEVGQDQIVIAAGTVMSVTSSPAAGGGFLLDMISVDLLSVPEPDADFDNDDDVDSDDLATWKANFGSAANASTGDADGDGDADGADFLQWQRELTGSLEPAASAPEPSAAALLLIAGVACWRGNRRRTA